jgi:hypothetical protein
MGMITGVGRISDSKAELHHISTKLVSVEARVNRLELALGLLDERVKRIESTMKWIWWWLVLVTVYVLVVCTLLFLKIQDTKHALDSMGSHLDRIERRIDEMERAQHTRTNRGSE